MKNSKPVAKMAAAIVFAGLSAGVAQAQTGLNWNPSATQAQDANPAKRVPEASAVVQAEPAGPQPQPHAPQAPAQQTPVEESQGGFFVGVQAGKGWVYEDVDQSALAINAGYRWQAGPTALVGFEVVGGRLGSTEHDGWHYGQIEYGSVGANARFNFGRTSPVYALVRGGYWLANDNNANMDVDGGYFGAGLGVDFNRNVSMNLTYTNYVYFQDYYWEDDEFYYDISSADTLMLGVEARF